MKIHKNYSSFIAQLSENELREYKLQFEDIDLYDGRTRKLLLDILTEHGVGLFSSYGRAKLAIDVIPDGRGGCIMLISIKRPPKYRVIKYERKESEKICVLFGAECLYPLAREISSLGRAACKGELYYNGKDYIVRASCTLPYKTRLFGILSEYGKLYPSTDFNKAALREHCKRLTDDFSGALCF